MPILAGVRLGGKGTKTGSFFAPEDAAFLLTRGYPTCRKKSSNINLIERSEMITFYEFSENAKNVMNISSHFWPISYNDKPLRVLTIFRVRTGGVKETKNIAVLIGPCGFRKCNFHSHTSSS